MAKSVAFVYRGKNKKETRCSCEKQNISFEIFKTVQEKVSPTRPLNYSYLCISLI